MITSEALVLWPCPQVISSQNNGIQLSIIGHSSISFLYLDFAYIYQKNQPANTYKGKTLFSLTLILRAYPQL